MVGLLGGGEGLGVGSYSSKHSHLLLKFSSCSCSIEIELRIKSLFFRNSFSIKFASLVGRSNFIKMKLKMKQQSRFVQLTLFKFKLS